MRLTGHILQAEPIYKRAIPAFKRLGKDHEKQLLEAFSGLGLVYQESGRNYLAGQVLSRARYWAKDLYGEMHAKHLEAMNRVGESQIAANSWNSAHHIFKHAFNFTEELPPDHPVRAVLLANAHVTNLSEFLRIGGRINCKIPAGLEKALRIANMHTQTDPTLNAKALAASGRYFYILANYFNQKKFWAERDECRALPEDHLSRSIQLTSQLHGHNHPLLARRLLYLADLEMDLKRYSDAAKNYRKALAIFRSRLHPGNVAIASSMTRLRIAYQKSGEKEKAIAIAVEYKKLPEHNGDFKVSYATTRDWNEEKQAYNQLGKKNELTYGTATVRGSRALWRRIDRIVASIGETDKSEEPLSYTKDFKILDITPGGLGDIDATIAKSARSAIRFPGQALLFIHGYNAKHKDAVKRAAQIAYDLEFDGALILFSWDSGGSPIWYVNDRKRAEAAAKPLFKFLDLLSIAINDVKVHIIAHSMGNRVLSRTIEKFAQRSPGARFPNLGEIIMAHSDIDLEWCQKMGKAKKFARGVTNYVNANDVALWVSSTIRLGEGRCGRVAKSYPGVETVDTTGMAGRKGETLLGMDTQNHHGVFVNDPILFGDIYRLLSAGRRPVHERTPEFRPHSEEGKPVSWVFNGDAR